jgi:predicted small secreted protein
MRKILPFLALLVAPALTGCMAVSAVGTAVDVVGTAVSTTADVAGSAIGAVTPDNDCRNGKDDDGDDC